ncbi:helix-turn-helix transcriptional regulator [Kocuria palustris]|uniref:helix-turn-helix transcriptional regulator n=1 Tax=Kocuria palustris TaxID=71999 RepID=UPI0035E2ACA4
MAGRRTDSAQSTGAGPRRAALAPDDDGPRRRVPGLRRGEVAARAGVSTDYCTRLEQGRHERPSESVQLALAEALELDPTAARHLQDLARALALPKRARPPTAEQQRLKHSLIASLLADTPVRAPGHRSLIHWAFLDPEAREKYVDWEKVASSMVGTLRLDAGRHPDDPQLAQLVGELSLRSEEFRTWWADHRVTERRDGLKRLNHQLVGRIDVHYEALEVTGAEDQTLFLYSTANGSDSEARLRTQASWLAENQPGPGSMPISESMS